MSDPFSNLKSTMKNTVFKEFSFSEERKKAVKDVIHGKLSQHHLHSWNIETLVAIFESLQYGAKHGYDISTQLIQKNERSFQSNEGQLYTLLHLLENKHFLTSQWKEEKKYYALSKKGEKYVAAYKRGSVKQQLALKHLLEEAAL